MSDKKDAPLFFKEGIIQENIMKVHAPRFMEFRGRIIDQMPILLSGQYRGADISPPRIPMTPKQVMYQRVNGRNDHDERIFAENCIDVAYPVLVYPDQNGEVVIGAYSDPVVKELVHSLNTDCEIKDGAVVINRDQYYAVRDCGSKLIISSQDAAGLRKWHLNDLKTRKDIWEFLAEGDTQLIKDNIELVKSTANKERAQASYLSLCENLNTVGLDFSLSWYKGMRLITMGTINNHGGGAFASASINEDYGRLIGVIENKSLHPTLEEVIKIGYEFVAPASKHAFRQRMTEFYEKCRRTED